MNYLLANFSSGTIVDIVCIVILLIISIICMSRGFVNQIFGIFTTIGAFLIAYFLCGTVVNLMNEWWGLTDKLSGSILSAFGGKEALHATLSPENIDSAISAMGLPQFIAEFAKNNLTGVADKAIEVGQYLSDILAGYIMIAIAFVALFIIAKLLLALLKKLLAVLTKLPIIHGLNKLLGFILGLVKGALILYGIIFVLGLLPSSVEFFNTVKTAMDQSVITKWMLENNFFAAISDWVVSFVQSIFA